MARPKAPLSGSSKKAAPDPTPGVAVDNGRFSSANFADADVILQSSDSVLFHVHRANLGALSAFFRDMFHVGNPDLSPADEWIPVSEREEVFELLLQMCYPADDGTPPVDFAKVESKLMLDVYEAAVKYQMWVAGLALRSFVEPLISQDPFLIVNLAHRLNDSVMLQRAVTATLDLDILKDTSKLRTKTGVLWPNLLEYHFRCRIQAQNYVPQQQQTLMQQVKNLQSSCGCSNCGSYITGVIQAAFQDQPAATTQPSAHVKKIEERVRAVPQYCGNVRNYFNLSGWPAPFAPVSEPFSTAIS